MEEAPTLTIYVCDTVAVCEGTALRAVVIPQQSPYIVPEFTFKMDKDAEWAPSQSRAPSITIDFDFVEAAF